MKISEFCKLYGISPQAVYAKIKRCESKPDNILDGHIKKIKGKSMEIDDFAAEYLRPKPANCDELFAEIEQLKEIITVDNKAISSMRDELDGISDIIEEILIRMGLHIDFRKNSEQSVQK